ncbi:MAG: dethiobiotin synthase [Clostridium sp.]
MNKGIFVLGTDTDMGKTFISALILKKLRLDLVKAVYFKGAISGAMDKNGELVPEDCQKVCEFAGVKPNFLKQVSYTLKNPYSPHLASRVENIKIDFKKIEKDFRRLQEEFDYILCEGSGGIICPISIEIGNEIMLEDIVKMTKLPVIIVSDSGLGSINKTVLTVNYGRQIGLEVKGIVLNKFDEENIIHRENKEVIKKLTGIKNILEIEENELDKINLDKVGEFIYAI